MWEDSEVLKSRQMKHPEQANLSIEKASLWLQSNLKRMGE